MEFIRVEDGMVVDRVTKIPENSQYTWIELIVIKPDLTSRQRHGNPQYNLSKNPAEFVYPVVEISESEKRTELLLKNRAKYRDLIIPEIENEFRLNKEYDMDPSIIVNFINSYRSKKEEILNCKNYDELEAIII